MKFGLSPLASTSFRIGIAGGFLLTVGLAILRAIEVTPINVELAIGSLLTRSFDPISWIVGFVVHLALCGVIGVLYGAAFEAIKRYGIGVGLGLGVVHWIASGVVMGLVPAMFSLVPELVGEPGYFGMYFGKITVIGNLICHLLFGGLVGALYAAARERQVLATTPTVPRLIEPSAEPVRRVA